jgi:glycosyltransferase
VLTQVAEAFEETGPDSIYTDLVYINGSGKIIRDWKSGSFTPKKILNGWMPPHPTLFIKKEIFEKYGLYRTDMKISADYEMVLRLFYRYKITVHYLPLTTYSMTIGGASNKSLRNIFVKSSEDYRAMKLHSIPFPVKTLVFKNLSKIPQFFNKK